MSAPFPKLTWNQGRALRNLGESRNPRTASNISDPIDFNGPWLSIAGARAAAKALVRMGLAAEAHVTVGPKRYELTDAGWDVLKQMEAVSGQ